MELTYPMDLKAYQRAKIQSFFNLGLKFSVAGDQLKVEGFKKYQPDERPGLQESIRINKSGIMAEVVRLQDRLRGLIRQADNFKGMTVDKIKAISEEGCQIMDQLPATVARGILENSK